MRFDAARLPGTVEALQSLVLDFVELRQNYEAEIKLLQEEISLLKHRLFGRKSEKLPVGSGQLLLFNEAEAGTAAETTTPPETIAVPAHERRNRRITWVNTEVLPSRLRARPSSPPP